MKQPKRLARWQKECLTSHRLNPDDWMLVEETEFMLRIVRKDSNIIKSVDKLNQGEEN